jgi:hypothetical protein
MGQDPSVLQTSVSQPTGRKRFSTGRRNISNKLKSIREFYTTKILKRAKPCAFLYKKVFFNGRRKAILNMMDYITGLFLCHDPVVVKNGSRSDLG